MTVYRSWKNDGEYFAKFRVRGHVRRIWLGTRDEDEAEHMEKGEIAIARATKHQLIKDRRGRHSVWWIVYDYIWEHTNSKRPGGVKNMYEALCTSEGYLCMKLRRYFFQFFKWKPLYKVTAEDVLTYQAARFELGTSAHTVGQEIQALFRLLKWAKLSRQVHNIRKGLRRMIEMHNGQTGWVYVRREPPPPRPRLVHRGTSDPGQKH